MLDSITRLITAALDRVMNMPPERWRDALILTVLISPILWWLHARYAFEGFELPFKLKFKRRGEQTAGSSQGKSAQQIDSSINVQGHQAHVHHGDEGRLYHIENYYEGQQ